MDLTRPGPRRPATRDSRADNALRNRTPTRDVNAHRPRAARCPPAPPPVGTEPLKAGQRRPQLHPRLRPPTRTTVQPPTRTTVQPPAEGLRAGVPARTACAGGRPRRGPLARQPDQQLTEPDQLGSRPNQHHPGCRPGHPQGHGLTPCNQQRDASGPRSTSPALALAIQGADGPPDWARASATEQAARLRAELEDLRADRDRLAAELQDGGSGPRRPRPELAAAPADTAAARDQLGARPRPGIAPSVTGTGNAPTPP